MTQSHPQSGERLQCTTLVAVLFIDAVGSTAWRSAVGDSIADRMREPFDDPLRTNITRHNGSVVKS